MNDYSSSFIAGRSISLDTATIDSSLYVVSTDIPTMGPKYLGVNALEKIKEYLDKRIDDLSKNPLYQHKCSSCGGTVELDQDKAIFICPYCGSHYALNTERINDRG